MGACKALRKSICVWSCFFMMPIQRALDSGSSAWHMIRSSSRAGSLERITNFNGSLFTLRSSNAILFTWKKRSWVDLFAKLNAFFFFKSNQRSTWIKLRKYLLCTLFKQKGPKKKKRIGIYIFLSLFLFQQMSNLTNFDQLSKNIFSRKLSYQKMCFVNINRTGKLCLFSNRFTEDHDLSEEEDSVWLHLRLRAVSTHLRGQGVKANQRTTV